MVTSERKTGPGANSLPRTIPAIPTNRIISRTTLRTISGPGTSFNTGCNYGPRAGPIPGRISEARNSSETPNTNLISTVETYHNHNPRTEPIPRAISIPEISSPVPSSVGISKASGHGQSISRSVS